MKRALQVILAVGLIGFVFSGYLAYREIFAASEALTCTPVGQPGTLLGYPPCLYGLAMYLVIDVTAALGLFATESTKRRSASRIHAS